MSYTAPPTPDDRFRRWCEWAFIVVIAGLVIFSVSKLLRLLPVLVFALALGGCRAVPLTPAFPPLNP